MAAIPTHGSRPSGRGAAPQSDRSQPFPCSWRFHSKSDKPEANITDFICRTFIHFSDDSAHRADLISSQVLRHHSIQLDGAVETTELPRPLSPDALSHFTRPSRLHKPQVPSSTGGSYSALDSALNPPPADRPLRASPTFNATGWASFLSNASWCLTYRPRHESESGADLYVRRDDLPSCASFRHFVATSPSLAYIEEGEQTTPMDHRWYARSLFWGAKDEPHSGCLLVDNIPGGNVPDGHILRSELLCAFGLACRFMVEGPDGKGPPHWHGKQVAELFTVGATIVSPMARFTEAMLTVLCVSPFPGNHGHLHPQIR